MSNALFGATANDSRGQRDEPQRQGAIKMTFIDGVRIKGRDSQSALPAAASVRMSVSTFGTRFARNWKAGSACIPGGLAGALLTCLASVGVNLLVDYGGMAFPAVLYLRKLATGYAAAASVVIVVFPLWPLMTRRLRSPALVETPR